MGWIKAMLGNRGERETLPQRVQQVEKSAEEKALEKARKSGTLDVMQEVKEALGNPDAKIEVNKDGVTLTWGIDPPKKEWKAVSEKNRKETLVKKGGLTSVYRIEYDQGEKEVNVTRARRLELRNDEWEKKTGVPDETRGRIYQNIPYEEQGEQLRLVEKVFRDAAESQLAMKVRQIDMQTEGNVSIKEEPTGRERTAHKEREFVSHRGGGHRQDDW